MAVHKIYKKGEMTLRDFAARNKHSNVPESLRDVQKQRYNLKARIKAVKNRLTFGYSGPLHQYRIELIRQDMKLLCQMTDELVKLSNQR